MSHIVQQLRDNATVLLSPSGARLPLAAVAGSLQLAADEIERLERELNGYKPMTSEELKAHGEAALKNEIAELRALNEEQAAELERRQAKIMQLRDDAERYRWLREHCRFANDSVQELWFDRSISDGEQSQLDAAIDAQRSKP
jgi:hypothetical protein